MSGGLAVWREVARDLQLTPISTPEGVAWSRTLEGGVVVSLWPDPPPVTARIHAPGAIEVSAIARAHALSTEGATVTGDPDLDRHLVIAGPDEALMFRLDADTRLALRTLVLDSPWELVHGAAVLPADVAQPIATPEEALRWLHQAADLVRRLASPVPAGQVVTLANEDPCPGVRQRVSAYIATRAHSSDRSLVEQVRAIAAEARWDALPGLLEEHGDALLDVALAELPLDVTAQRLQSLLDLDGRQRVREELVASRAPGASVSVASLVSGVAIHTDEALATLDALAALGESAGAYLAAAWVQADDDDVQRRAIEVLGLIGGPRDKAALRPLLGGFFRSAAVKQAAAAAIAAIDERHELVARDGGLSLASDREGADAGGRLSVSGANAGGLSEPETP